jgi:hypothetical protein
MGIKKSSIFFSISFLFLIALISFVNARIFVENNVYYVEQDLKEQWNLIAGISFSDIYSKSYLTKDAIFKSYYHDAKTNTDIEIRPDYKAGNIDPLILYSNAFWVFSAKTGKITYKASPSFVNKSRIGGYYQFYSGDNLIAINDEMYGKSLDELKGNCSITDASFWDASLRNWTKLNVYDKLNFETQDSLVGKGIRIKVAKDCGFFTTSRQNLVYFYVSLIKPRYYRGEQILLN